MSRWRGSKARGAIGFEMVGFRPFGIIAFAGCALLAACTKSSPPQETVQPRPPELTLSKDEERNAYALGADLGKRMHESGMRLEIESFLAGIRDGLEGHDTRIGQDEISTRVKGVREQERFRRQEELAANNRAAAQAFFTQNAAVKGVITTPSGLQYQVLEPGAGERPTATDIVTVNYRGTLLDGTEFDSSYARNQPAKFPLNRVIKGWTEGLQLMQVGARYKLFVPSELAYGQRGAGELIGPDAALVFEVELLGVEATNASAE